MATTAAVLNILVNAQTGTASASLRRLSGELKATAAQGEKSSSKMGKAVKAVGFAAAGLASYGLYKSVKVAADFEKQLDSTGAVANANAKQLKALEQQAIKTGQATFYSANETAKAQEELVKGGLSVKQVLGGALPAALSLAEAGQLDLATASETTVNVMKLFGLQGRDASKIADMLATAANKTTADVGDFAMALKQGGSVAKLAGLDLNNTVTILEALAESGIKNSDAGTSMKTAMIQLLKPTEKQAKLAKELGITWTTQNGKLKDAAGLSKELRDATDGMTKSERAKTLATLAGTDGVRALNAVYEAGPAKLRALEQANNKQGTAQEIARKKMDNFAGQVEQFKGSLETLGIKVGQLLIPSLKRLAAGATKVTNEVTQIFSDKTLSGPEKFKKAFGLVFDRILEQASRLFPKIADGAAAMAPKVAMAFVKGFVNSGIWAKLAVGGFLLAKFGGVGAFGKLGTKTGQRWASAFLLAVLSTELAKQVKEIIEGHELGAPDSEKFSMYLKEYFEVDAAKIVAPNRVKITTALGSLIFNSQTEKVIKAQGNELQQFVGRTPEEIVTKFQKLGRLNAILQNSFRPLPGTGAKAGTDLQKSILPKLDELKLRGGKKADAFAERIGGAFNSMTGSATTAMDTLGFNVSEMLKTLGGKAPKYNLKKALGSLPELKPMGRQGKQTGGAIVPGTGSGDTHHTILPAGSFILNREATKEAPRLATGGMMPVALEPGERIFLPNEVAKYGAKNLEAMNKAVPRFQKGGQLGGEPQMAGPPGALLDLGQGAIHKTYEAAKEFLAKHKPKPSAGGVGGYTGPPANMKQLGDNAWVDAHTLAVAAYLSKQFGISISSSYRTPQHNAEVGGVPNSFHTHGSMANPGAIDFVPPSSAALNFATSHIAGLEEAMIHDVGSGLHLHLAFFNKGGLLQKLAKGGGVKSDREKLGDAFHQVIGEVWPKAAAYYGRSPKSRPPMTLIEGMKSAGETWVADSARYGKAVALSPAAARGVVGFGEPSGRGTLLHEWAHVFQRGGLKKWEAEGGAEAFKGWAGPQIFPGAAMAGAWGSRTAAYEKYKQEVFREKSEDWIRHEQFKHLGGMVQMLAKGGFAGDGYTVKGHAATSQQMHTAGEIQKAADTTGANHLARVASMMAATQESVMGASGNTFQLTGDFEGVSPSDSAYTQAVQWFGKGYYEGGGIELSHTMSDPGDIAQAVEGSAYPDAYDPWKAEGQKWTDGWGGKGDSGAHSYKEDVKARYNGLSTKSLSFGAVPKSLPGIKKELAKRRHEVKRYRAAADDAKAKKLPATAQALQHNVTALEGRIRELERALALAKREAAKRKITKRYSKALGALTGFEDLIAAKERHFNKQSQYAEQVVALEPLMPEISEKATNAQREAIEKVHIAGLSSYITGQEEPAYQALLASAGDWRNTILSAQEKAAGNWQSGKTLGGLEGNWEDKIIATGNEIEHINDFTKKTADSVAKWKKGHGKDPFPDWLKDAVKKDHKDRARLPVLRFTEEELRKTLGVGREKFYPGKARITRPNPPFAGSGSFEEALSTVQGVHWPEQHEKIVNLPAVRAAGQAGGVIWDVQTTIAELGMKLRDARVEGGGGTEADSEGDSESAEYWKEQARLANQRNLVFERQKPIIDAYEKAHPMTSTFAGMFAKGGSIAAGQWGIAGEAGPEIVQGPAQVFSSADSAGMVGGASSGQSINLEVLVLDGAVDVNKIKAIANGEAVKVTKKQGKGARSLGAQRAGRIGG